MASTSLAPLPSIQPTVRRRWVDLGLVILIGIVPLVLRAIYVLVVPIGEPLGSTNYRLLGGLVHEFSALILFYCLLKRQGRSLRDIGLSFHWTDIPKAVGLGFLCFIAMYLCWVGIWIWSSHFQGHRPQVRDAQVIFGGASAVISFLYLLAAPIFEETIVRAYLMTELIELSWPPWLAVVLSFLLQGSYHLYYGVSGAILVSAGFVVLSIYFAKSRRLMPVLLCHLLWDLCASYLGK